MNPVLHTFYRRLKPKLNKDSFWSHLGLLCNRIEKSCGVVCRETNKSSKVSYCWALDHNSGTGRVGEALVASLVQVQGFTTSTGVTKMSEND